MHSPLHSHDQIIPLKTTDLLVDWWKVASKNHPEEVLSLDQQVQLHLLF
jgi:hypothetical protein